MAPKVSVIVPVYNVSAYLGQCLDTILLQTLQDIEVICVDDGSTDGSLDILNTYAFLDNRLKVIHQENAGAAAARNRGLKEATGEFISVLDSDDFFHPEMLEKMVQKAEADQADVVVCGYSMFSDKTQKEIMEYPLSSDYVYRSPMTPKDFGNDLFMFCFLPAWNKLVRTSFLKKHKICFDEKVRYCDDNMFSLWVLGVAGKISCMSECFVHYRWDTEGQQSQNKPSTVVEDHCKTQSLAYEKIKESNPNYDLLSSYLPRVKKSLFFCVKNLETNKKRKGIMNIKTNLHSDLYNALFDSKKTAISVIICAFNGAEFLSECLDSCLNQTLKNIEIICVDDGSTDNTLNIFKEYAQKDNRIKVIHHDNQGLPISRNKAMEIATGEYIQFLDADDYLESDACECLYLYAKINDLDMLSFAAIEFNNDTKIEFENSYHIVKWLPEKFEPAFTWQHISTYCPNLPVTSGLTIYRFNYLKNHKIHWINKKICYEDTLFFHEALLQGATMGALKDKFCHKRVHNAAITQNLDSNFPDYCQIVKLILKKCCQLFIPNQIFIQYLYYFLNLCYNQYEQKLMPEAKNKKADILYKFAYDILKKYRYPLPNSLRLWCEEYLKNKKKSKYILFYFYSFLANWKINGYSLIHLSLNPFSISILNKSFNIFPQRINIKKADIPEKDRIILCFDLFDPKTEAVDAYTFFCYLQKKEIPSKYVIHPGHPLLKSITNLKDIVFSTSNTFFTDCSSLLSKSKYVISSFGLDRKNAQIRKLPWIKYIFIDHGVILLNEHVLKIYTKDNFHFINTPSVATKKLYTKKHLWKNKQIFCGLPRWDNLKRIPHKNKNIFVFFTWRKSIEKYPTSHKQYEERILNFLNSSQLNALLKEHNVTLNMALHHAMLSNNTTIDVPENVHLIPQTEISKVIGAMDLVITDMSSIVWDFMFLDIPAIFYRFDDDIRYPDKRDRLNAKSAKSHDKELYNVFYDEDSVIQKIEYYIKNDFVLEPEYKKINASLFWEKENICEHLYEKIKSL